MRLLLLPLIFLHSLPGFAANDCVVLLHGLARTDSSMKSIEQALEKESFFVQNVAYPSQQEPIAVLANMAIPPALSKCGKVKTIHFVTHSMGGILVRKYFNHHVDPRLGRVVMLGPPNKGSEVVDVLGGLPGFHFINGDAGLQLSTDTYSVPNQLGPVNFNLGVIAGTRSINWILSLFIPGVDDGKVSVENTKVQGMNDHISLPVTHTFMMNNKQVIQQVIYYLRHGHFDHITHSPIN